MIGAIPNDRVYETPDGERGKEDEVHVTIKYGIHTKDVDAIREMLQDWPALKATLRNVSSFCNEDSVVLKLSVQSEDLVRLNAQIRKVLECTDTYPEYRPHITLAYLKKDESDPYYFRDYFTDEFDGTEVLLDELIFTTPDGDKHTIRLGDAMNKTARKILAAAGPLTLLEQVRDDLRRGKLQDDHYLYLVGYGWGHTPGVDYIFGDAGSEIAHALIGFAMKHKSKEEVLRIVEQNIVQALRDNEAFRGLRGEQRETHEIWMNLMKRGRAAMTREHLAKSLIRLAKMMLTE